MIPEWQSTLYCSSIPMSTRCLQTLGLVLALVACGSGEQDAPDAGASGTTGSGAVGGNAEGGDQGGAAGAGGSAEPVAMPCTLPPRNFWTWELSVMPPLDAEISATCVAETEHAYIHVASDVWTNGKITQAQVEKIARAFEKQTPSDPTRGIYQTDVDTFGSLPDVDSDPRINLFYYPMSAFQGTSFDGYFRPVDQSPGRSSNETEMLHLNSSASDAPDSDYMLGVVIHELVHLIGWQHDQDEEDWLDEALAESAMALGGYTTDLAIGRRYVSSTDTIPLCLSGYSDYGATFSWGSYMLDRWGPSFLRDVLADPGQGATSLESHLPGGASFRDVFGEFMVATLLDQPSIGDGRWGFESVDLSALGSETPGVIDGASHMAKSVAWGASMLRFTPSGAGTLEITLATTAAWSTLIAHTIRFDPNQPSGASVERVTPSDQNATLSVAVASGQVVDLVVAIDGGRALASTTGAPVTDFAYVATFMP